MGVLSCCSLMFAEEVGVGFVLLSLPCNVGHMGRFFFVEAKSFEFIIKPWETPSR